MRPDIDPREIRRIIEDVARREILPRFRALRPEEIIAKSSSSDLVTAADLASEAALSEALRAALPGSVVVGEEGVYRAEDQLSTLMGDAPVWVLDPVDGTGNFAHGRPRFAVIVALCLRNEMIGGWIHDPLGLRTMWAWNDVAWMDEKPIPPLTPAPQDLPLKSLRGVFPGRVARLVGGRFGRRIDQACAGHDYINLAEDQADFLLYGRLMPWDHAAGVLVHRIRGGHAAILDGTPYAPHPPGRFLLLARDKGSWTRLRDVFLPALRELGAVA